ncbi:MAG: FG-GAP-like repeat-containing protein [Planctomycetota bacterium]
MLHRNLALALVALTAFASPLAAQLTVTGSSPANNARGVSTAALVTLTFSLPLNPATVTAQNFKLCGRWSGPVPCTLTIGGGGNVVTMAPQRPLFSAEIATLNVTRFVAATTGALLTGGHMANWWLDSAPSTGTFQLAQVVNYRLPGEGLIRTYGFFAGDVDRDGAPDMSATNEVSWDVRLLKNDGCGNFAVPVVTPMPNGEEPSPNEGADFNGDGWIDLATGNQLANSVAILLNSGSGSWLTPVIYPVGGQVHGLAVVDCDSDGDTDVVATNMNNIALLRNNGNGTFAPATFFNGGGNGEWSIAVADANGDGKPDIFCGTNSTQALSLLLGDGNGTFTFATSVGVGGFPWQMATGDIDGDGDVDCVCGNRTNGTARVFFGNGIGGLAAGPSYAVGDPVSVDVGDVEGDDDLDIVTADFGTASGKLWRNNGAGVFANPTTFPLAMAGSCGVLVDHDRDGDTDIIIVDELADQGFVFRQVGPTSPTAQPPGCTAALRVNNFANRAGYGGAPARVLPGGQLAFFGVSGGPFELVALFAGERLDPGLPSPFGLVGLDLLQPVNVLWNTFTDAKGEAGLAVMVPTGLPPGATLTMQCVLSVSASGVLVLSNPEQVAF